MKGAFRSSRSHGPAMIRKRARASPAPGFPAGRGRGQAPPQVRIRGGDLTQEDVADGPGGLDQLLQDRRVALVEQRPVVVDGGPGAGAAAARRRRGEKATGESRSRRARRHRRRRRGCDHLRESSTESGHICCCDGDFRDHHMRSIGKLSPPGTTGTASGPRSSSTRSRPRRTRRGRSRSGNPFCFYEGHLPAFSVITLLQRGLGDPPIDAELETLFRARHRPRGRVRRDGEGTRVAVADRDPQLRGQRGPRDPRGDPDARHRGSVQPGAARRAGRLHTILEHEPMHQETLRYIRHRLPYDLKIRPEDLRPPVIGGEPPRPRSVRVPAGRATLGADRRTRPFAWDNELPRHCRRRRRVRDRRVHVTNRDYLEFVEAGGYENASLWDEEGWAWARRPEGASIPLFWERQRRRLALARDVGPDPAAHGVAGLRHPRGGVGLRALEGKGKTGRLAPPDRGRVPPGRVRHARRARARVSVGRRAARLDARQLRLRLGRSRPGRLVPARTRAPGASTTSSATAGSGPRRCSRPSRASSRWRRIRSTRRTSSTASTTS